MRKILIGVSIFLIAEIAFVCAILFGLLDKKTSIGDQAMAMDAVLHLPENPRAAKASPYPHPKLPDHLVSVSLEIDFPKAINSIVRISQKRAKDGWYINGVREIKKGKLSTLIELDGTLRDPTILMLSPVDKDGRASNEIILYIPSNEIAKNKTIRKSVSWF